MTDCFGLDYYNISTTWLYFVSKSLVTIISLSIRKNLKFRLKKPLHQKGETKRMCFGGNYGKCNDAWERIGGSGVWYNCPCSASKVCPR